MHKFVKFAIATIAVKNLHPHVCYTDEVQSHPASPMLLLVTSDGMLICYYMMLSVPNTPSLTIQPQPLQAPERPCTYCGGLVYHRHVFVVICVLSATAL